MTRRGNRRMWIAATVAACAVTLGASPLSLHAKDADAPPTLDELLNLPEPPSKPNRAQPGDNAAPRVPLPEGEEAKGGDAFAQAVVEMKQAADRLASAGDTGLPTQRIQERIIRRLDQQIAELNKQQQQQKQKQQQQQQQDTGAKSNQQKPGQQKQQSERNSQAHESADKAGQKGEVKNGQLGDEPLTERLSEWGNLPPRLRKQLLQGWEDNFSQLYRDLTERYYRRLAEEGR
ncbi:MAG: hypothetical protein GC159_21020 [Phycisphaera sp.]|nr:hypothetical protein [Phycisphaera sp.]